MTAPRLSTKVWVDAYLKRLELEMIPAYIARKGDATAGAVLVKVATLDGRAACYQRSWDLDTGDRTWVVLSEGPEDLVEASISKQASFDPDIWVVELETRDGRHLLDEEGLS